MKMKKVFVQNTGIAFVYASNYGKSVAKVNKLSTELKSDYPSLSDDDIEVDFFSGSDRLDHVIHVYARVGESAASGYQEVEDRSYFY